MWRSSKGCRITSSTERGNSGNSSRKRTPLWAKLISQVVGYDEPPHRATAQVYDYLVEQKRLCRFSIRDLMPLFAILKILIFQVRKSHRCRIVF